MLVTYTASVFRIEPLTGVPVEPLVDLVPGVTPMRVTYDMVDNETIVYQYDVTEHAIQGFLDVTTHVRKRLETITIVGTLSGMGPLLPGPQPPNPPGVARLDVHRVTNLRLIADTKLPVMILTPRMGLSKAFITSVQQQWGPADADSCIVTITAKEARLVLPGMTAPVSPDYPAQAPGNNAASGGGQGAPGVVDTPYEPSAVPGLPPDVAGGVA